MIYGILYYEKERLILADRNKNHKIYDNWEMEKEMPRILIKYGDPVPDSQGRERYPMIYIPTSDIIMVDESNLIQYIEYLI